MFKKIAEIYENTQVLTTEPSGSDARHYYWFYDSKRKEWLGIPRTNVSKKELQLLTSFFEYFEPPSENSNSLEWVRFLFSHGKIPIQNENGIYRIIQFSCTGKDLKKQDFEMALQGFFAKGTLFIWKNQKQGLVIERKARSTLQAEQLSSISLAIESDLYTKVLFYVGKYHELGQKFPSYFQIEKDLFQKGMELLPSQRAITFEMVFPLLVTAQLGMDLQEALMAEILERLKGENELLYTVQTFIENNMNASMTAKQLYIHRNTLQYRLEKFTEKTGISLKDFPSAFTMYVACLLQFPFNNQEK